MKGLAQIRDQSSNDKWGTTVQLERLLGVKPQNKTIIKLWPSFTRRYLQPADPRIPHIYSVWDLGLPCLVTWLVDSRHMLWSTSGNNNYGSHSFDREVESIIGLMYKAKGLTGIEIIKTLVNEAKKNYICKIEYQL